MKTNKLTVAAALAAALAFVGAANAAVEFEASKGMADSALTQTVTSTTHSTSPSDLRASITSDKTFSTSPLTLTAPVPEPSTIIAGLLMLLPFGACALRIVHKRKTT
jgi:hypothetical protein